MKILLVVLLLSSLAGAAQTYEIQCNSDKSVCRIKNAGLMCSALDETADCQWLHDLAEAMNMARERREADKALGYKVSK